MIIKIENYINNDTGELITDSWWMLDDIRKIRKHVYYDFPFNIENIDNADIFILDYEDYLEKNNMARSGRNVIKLVCRLSNSNEFIVLFDTIAYILNDEGKTVEKIVANYRIVQN